MMPPLYVEGLVAQDESPVPWRIDELHVVGHNTTLTAGFKVGKSTLMLNLLRSLADGVPFMGQNVLRPEGRTLYWNLEVSDGQMRDWCRKVGIGTPERIMVHNLRGRRLPLYDDKIMEFVAAWLEEHEIECWIIDPAVRLFAGWPGVGNPENDNGAVGDLVDRLDRIKQMAGVQDLWLPIHTGRAGAHARGATRWDDWTDARWMLSKRELGDEEIRFFSANGRDVDFKETACGYDPGTYRVWAEANFDGMQLAADARAVVKALRSHPGELNGTMLRTAITGVKTDRKAAAVAEAERRGWVRRDRVGGTLMTFLNEAHPEVIDMQISQPGKNMEVL